MAKLVLLKNSVMHKWPASLALMDKLVVSSSLVKNPDLPYIVEETTGDTWTLLEPKNTAKPSSDYVKEIAPIKVSGIWTQQWKSRSFTESELSAYRDKAWSDVKTERERHITGVMPMVLSGGTFNYPYSESMAVRYLSLYQSVTDGLKTLPAYWRDDDNNHNVLTLDDYKIIAQKADEKTMLAWGVTHNIQKNLLPAATSKSQIDGILLNYKANPFGV